MAKVNTGFRLDPQTIDKIERVAALMAKRAGGLDVKPAEAARAALNRGLDVLLVELAVEGEKAASKPQK